MEASVVLNSDVSRVTGQRCTNEERDVSERFPQTEEEYR